MTHTPLKEEKKAEEIKEAPEVVIPPGEMLKNVLGPSGGKEYRYKEGMVRALGNYAEQLINDGEKESKVQRVMTYFLSEYTQENGNLITPLERISEIYEFLDNKLDTTHANELQEAITSQSQELARRAFDQHLENPQQYVSHGFDHSINVANYARDIYEQNTQIITAMMKNYGVLESEAKFLLETVCLFHDIGYPDLQGRGKAVHGISGADIISTDSMRSLFDSLIQTADKDQQNLIMNDIRNAILFHSADKVEQNFGVKIDTTRGSFLTNTEAIVGVISLFDKSAKSTIKVEVSDVQSILDINKSLTEAKSSGQLTDKPTVSLMGQPTSIDGREVIFFPITTNKGNFPGRRADIETGIATGLAFKEIDLLSSPLHAIVRLADNMDMRKTRFSKMQREPVFEETYRLFGDTRRPTAQALAKMEKGVNEGTISSEQLANYKSEQIAAILRKDASTQTEIIHDLLMKLSSETMRHFGGCEAIDTLKLEKSVLTITVDATKYTDLNGIQVDEINTDGDAKKVGVGEYQIWRLIEAYKSISFDGRPIQVKIIDENGDEISLTNTPSI